MAARLSVIIVMAMEAREAIRKIYLFMAGMARPARDAVR